MLAALAGLIVVLPIAHTNALRSVAMISVLVLWFLRMRLQGKMIIARTRLEIPLLLFLLTILLSLFSSLKLSTSLNELRGEFIIPVALFYLAASNFRQDKHYRFLFWTLCLAASGICAVALGNFFLQGGRLNSYAVRAGFPHQGFGALAQYLVIVIPYSLMGMVWLPGRREKIVLALILALQLFTLYVTYTRGSWVGAALAVFMMPLLLGDNLRRKLILLGICCLLGLLVALCIPEEVIWHGESKELSLDEAQLEKKNTATNRLIMWKTAAEYLSKHPFTGAGFGKANYRRRFAGKQVAGYEQAHNTFVNLAVQLGLQGLLALLFILYRLLGLTWRGYKQGGADRWRRIFCGGSWLMIWGFFAGNQFAEFFIDDTALLFWILCGLSLGIAGRDGADEGA